MKKLLALAIIGILGLSVAGAAAQTNPIYPVSPNTPQPNRIILSSCSGTITTGGTSQSLLPQNYNRSYLVIYNLSSTNEFLGIDSTVSATTGMLLLPNTGYIYYPAVPVNSLWIFGATTGQQFGCFSG